MVDDLSGEFKFPRAINARKDPIKVEIGPALHEIESRLFKLLWFVKFVPVRLRPTFIKERLFVIDGIYFSTDYTAFESAMVPALLKAVELPFYHYMLQQCAGGQEVASLLTDILAGENVMKFKNVTARVQGVRMSGDMCTSLGNGFVNLMVMLTVCRVQGITVDGVVEGDDGLFSVSEPPAKENFANCGMLIKSKVSRDLGRAGFCKMIFDIQAQQNVKDPRPMLAKFGWTHSRLRHSRRFLPALLRSKAYSLMAELPGCPIAGALARYGLRVATGGASDEELYTHRAMQSEYRMYRGPSELLPIAMATRRLVEQAFGVSVALQLAIEQYLDGLTQYEELPFTDLMPSKWRDFYDKFVVTSSLPSQLCGRRVEL